MTIQVKSKEGQTREVAQGDREGVISIVHGECLVIGCLKLSHTATQLPCMQHESYMWTMGGTDESFP